jgi:hypothetical protein
VGLREGGSSPLSWLEEGVDPVGEKTAAVGRQILFVECRHVGHRVGVAPEFVFALAELMERQRLNAVDSPGSQLIAETLRVID